MKILYCEKQLTAPGLPADVSLLVDSSLSRNFHPLFLPPHSDEWKLTLGLAVKIMRLGKYIAPRFAPRYYDAVTLVARLRPAGLALPAPATLTAFDSAAVVGEWLPVPADSPAHIAVEGSVNSGITFARAEIDALVAHLSTFFTLKTGDIIVAGDIEPHVTPAIGTTLTANVNGETCICCKIK